jgi:hypothetical protein
MRLTVSYFLSELHHYGFPMGFPIAPLVRYCLALEYDIMRIAIPYLIVPFWHILCDIINALPMLTLMQPYPDVCTIITLFPNW